MMHTLRPTRSTIAPLIGAVLLAATLATVSPAQTTIDAPRFDGRGFSGINLPQPVETYGLSFRAVRGHAWREAGANRIVLERDVDVRIGLYDFHASSAVIWLELIEINGRISVY